MVHMHAKEEKSTVPIPNPELSALQMMMETLKDIWGELDQLEKSVET